MPAVAPATADASTRAFHLGQSDLQRIEQALLDAFRSNNTRAIDELLNDPTFAGDRTEVERFLAAAVTDTQPDRNRALDQILGNGIQSPPFAAHA